jgi:hypothetical protein
MVTWSSITGGDVRENDGTLPALDPDLFQIPTQDRLTARKPLHHKACILLLYGSLREQSY